MPTPSRRNLMKTTAWTVPTVAVASAAPAVAATGPSPYKFTSTTYSGISYGDGGKVNGYNCNGKGQFEVSNNKTGTGISLDGGTSKITSLSNLTMTFWIAVEPGTTWTNFSGNSCWTTPTATGSSTSAGSCTTSVCPPAQTSGTVYYAYRSTFTCTFTNLGGTTWSLPSTQRFAWRSSCQSWNSLKDCTSSLNCSCSDPATADPKRWFYYEQTITVNGSYALSKKSAGGFMC